MWNKDELEGKGKQIKGKAKDKAGEIISNPELETEGEAERVEGWAQEGIGRARRKAEEAEEKFEDAVKKEHD
jgi:uncharacterized protein YjbJ (UPF0337 family)